MPENSKQEATNQVGTEARACPLCGREAGESDVEVAAPIRAAALSGSERGEYWRGFRSRPCFFDYARCRSCGLLFCPTYFTQDALDELYASMPDNTAGASADVLRRTQRSYIAFLAEDAPLAGTYLEIGPDIGLATEAALSGGRVGDLVLVEPNRGVHDQLRVVGEGHHTLLATSIGDVPADVGAEAAVVVHVLDHLIEPMSFLADLKVRMAGGARMLVVVHSETSLLRRLLGRRWPPFTLQHPQLFSPRTLRSMLERAGFGVVRESATRNYFPLGHLARTACSVTGLPNQWTDRLPSIDFPVRLGNRMTVAEA